jgi:hypothetical protein
MNETTLDVRIVEALNSADPIGEMYRIADELRESRAGIASVRSILRVMENDSTGEFGIPGPLVKFVEEFRGAGYEEELLASLRRRPTAHTAMMLDRLINGTQDADQRTRMIAALREAASHADADESAKNEIAFFLSDL